VLWADAIRARIIAAVRTGDARRRTARPSTTVPVTSTPPCGPGDLAATALAWAAAAGLVPDVVPPAVLALGDPAVAAEVLGRMTPEAWDSLSNNVSRMFSDGIATRPMDTTAARAAPEGARPMARAPEAMRPVPAAATTEDVTVGERPGRPASRAPILNLLAELAPLVADRGEGLDPAAVTRAAGLVLLYPWLAEHCRRAEALHPALDPLDVREAALAMVVEPADPGLPDDPLVALLSGRPIGDVRARDRARLPRGDEVAESADRIVSSFAATLRGFERSSARFVRDAWIVRLGVLDTDRDPVLLTAATHPLDVVLSLLSYPIGLVKLPWSPPVTTRFR